MNKYINNLKGLDILRFILSFSIIIWHYQHFFYPFVPENQRNAVLTQQPFYHVFTLFYAYGNYAVQFFWLVSGIIFYKIYEQKIAAGKISFGNFFVKRFTRLYPLHFITLILVLLLQQICIRMRGEYFIYPQNGIKEFFLNVFFIQSWGFNKFSFNGPTWSVSIEILAYLIFFILAFSKLIGSYKGLISTAVFFAVLKKWQLIFLTVDMRDCIYFFFLGCIFIKVFEQVQTNTRKKSLFFGCLLLIWSISYYNEGRPENIYHVLTGFLDVNIVSLSMLVVMSMLLFFNLPFFDRVNLRVFSTLGNMTYSTYLIHFPIQLSIILLLQPADYSLFLSNTFFIAYFCSTILLGYLVYEFFELPIQVWMRKQSQVGD